MEQLSGDALLFEPPEPIGRVMVVDDNPDDVATISQFLRLEGYTVAGFISGAALLGDFPTFRPDVVIVDLEMPSLSGYEVARTLKDARLWQSVLLIAITGHGSHSDRFLSQLAGIDYHLTKPFDPKVLVGLIRGHVRRDVNAGPSQQCH
jgi:twitching motility two-component system response regulator PilH